MQLGNFVKQPQGYKAYIPADFPPSESLLITPDIILANDAATRALSKLDGVAQLIPDINFFTFMYVRKEAALSSNIEGTKATMHDSLKADIEITEGVPKDVENITHYISALNYGLDRLKDLPLSTRLIKEIHNKLMAGTAEGIGKTPGQIRTSQNWINGTKPENSDFVPPPPTELSRCLKDFDTFLNTEQPYTPLVQAALMHAQFETIHPFLDGNGRTGRLLITLHLCSTGVLEYPILYISEYFKKYRDVYFDRLSGYHNESDINGWLLFFLEGIETVAKEATIVSKEVVKLRERDGVKIQSLGGRQSESAMKLLMGLYRQPIVDVATVEKITGLSRPAANALVKKFTDIGVLAQADEDTKYGREFSYDEYLALFVEK